MSRLNPSICCCLCGRYLYTPFECNELRENNNIYRHVDYYSINDDGRENEVCPKCFEYWKKKLKSEVIENGKID